MTGAGRGAVGAAGLATSARASAVDAFVDAAFTGFEQAYCHPGNGAEDHVVLAGRPVRLRFAGPNPRARLLPAVRHLLGPDTGQPTLTVCCWDGASAPADFPDPPWPKVDFLRDGRIRGHIAGPIVATYAADERLFQLYDRARQRALFHVGDARDLPRWHDRSPFRLLLGLWADDHGLAVLHGATVAENGVAVVLAGPSGAGKSTSAMSCTLAGMNFLGDDACLVEVDRAAGTAGVHSLYGDAKLEADASDWLCGREALLRVGPVRHDDDHSTVVSPARLTTAATLGAVLLVSIGGRRGSVLSDVLPPETALEPLMDTVREESRGLTPAACVALGAVVESVPVRRLVAGTDRAQLVDAVRAALQP